MEFAEIDHRCRELRVLMPSFHAYCIAQELNRFAPCRLLVFGLGNDSILWHRLNPEGRTVFLEDDPHWLNLIGQRYPELEAYAVHYGSGTVASYRQTMEEIGSRGDALIPHLDGGIGHHEWDMAIVDGPKGYTPSNTGRVLSIYTAARLVRAGGVVFVHDSEREVEDVASRTYLPGTLDDIIFQRIGLRKVRRA
jgi:uncharacterized protein (TIGR01627 family)